MECPSPFRYTRPFRINSGSKENGGLLTKWGFTEEELDSSHVFFPTYCVGWAYLITPATGIQIAETATNMPPDLMKVNKIDDVFLGYVMQQIKGSKIEQLEGGHNGFWWNNLLSDCPFMSRFKLLYMNPVVVEKAKYKKGLKVTFWYNFCVQFDKILSSAQYPKFLSNLCKQNKK